MAKPSLTLLFPQWQGSGSPQAPLLKEGAEQIAELLETPPISVSLADSELETQADINARSSLLQQLKTASTLLSQHQPQHLFTVGGDCGVDLAPASYLNARHDDLALVWLDAHGDLNTPASSPSGAFHGMVLRTLLGEGDTDFLDVASSTFKPEQVFLAGTREFDPPERAFAEGLEHISVNDLERQPTLLAERIEAGGFTKLHIHLDLDVLDPTEFASLSYPTPNGLSLEGLTGLLETLNKRFEVVGLTLTEFMPKEKGDLAKVQKILNVTFPG